MKLATTLGPMRRLLRRAACAAGLLSAALSAWAGTPSDIDIYAGASGATDRPNVLMILDSSANWSVPTGNATCYYKENGVTTSVAPSNAGDKGGIEQCALYNLVDALPVQSGQPASSDALFNIGIMLMNEPNNSGGYPRKAFIAATTNNKAVLKTLIKGLVLSGSNSDKGSNADFGQALYEAYLMFKGLAPLNGTLGSKYDTAAISGGRYVSPSGNSCARNVIIVIGNGSPQNSNPEKSVESLMATRIDADLATLSSSARAALKAKIVNASLGGDEANWADEMARFMRLTDVSGREDMQGIITHALAVRKNNSSDGDFPALMQSVANYGGGRYAEATTADGLTKALIGIFYELQAVNSVFASASLPVSVNARGTFQNQIYMGMFRPDANGSPRWRGNLKQYKFALDSTNTLFLADATGAQALSAATGFFSPTATSYWSSASTFWTAETLGTPPSSSDAPDGEVVEKGGVSQRLRTTYATSQDGRKVYTCISCTNAAVALSTNSAAQFHKDNAAITQAMLGVSTSSDRINLINWLRGTNNALGEPGPATAPATTVRPSVHGDVLHSRPAVVNYGGSTGVVVYYGANDGQLHAVNGNQSGGGAGDELWSFVPEEHFGKLKRLRDNTPFVDLSTTPAGLGAVSRDYFVDGPIGVYQKVNCSAPETCVVIIVGMRRGGRQLYALDVTTPSAPKFLWKVTNATAGMSLLGQTWSEPKVARVKGHTNPVVIFGGGYDATAEDVGGLTSMGNAIYVLDALDGTVLKTFTTLSGASPAASLNRSIAADVTLIDHNNDGFVDRGYAVDLGGQIYRVDFETETSNAIADWSVFKVADLSGGTTTGRKFFFGPDAVVTRSFTALLLGSGDREKPLLSATQDHFFQVFDRRLLKGAPAVAAPYNFASLNAVGTTSSIAGNGCYMTMAVGEKVVNAAAAIAGTAYFGTNRPSASTGNTCSANLGVAKSYAMPLFCVAATGSVLTGGGLPPSPVAGIVTLTNSQGVPVQVPFVIGAPNAKGSAIEGSRVNPTIAAPRQRRYWYREDAR